GIQAMDLLGRKVRMDDGRGLQLLAARIQASVQAATQLPELSEEACELAAALQQALAATEAAWPTGEPAQALANAVPYMQALGHVVLAWMWLDVARASLRGDAQSSANAGRRAAARYFFRYELPRIGAWLNVVRMRDMTCAEMDEAGF